ncbi:MAG TPA: hypothetical protein DCL41_01645 [Bdellovibrionales bacterium]|nr:hypothetical protein [Pseudobdellovibrionaceae bacterium]HAG90542.1 hypothetical protein [Bdellovibrionales bacterium]|tara:strand:- start:1761 stop:2096 length:336 start_codon:yes stop_codon:yes gene_type:complete
MDFYDVQYKFEGFSPDREFGVSLALVADKIKGLAPSDAAVRWRFSQISDQVQVSCRISSCVGIFSAEAKSPSAHKALRRVQNKILRKLDHWKNQRFLGTIFPTEFASKEAI